MKKLTAIEVANVVGGTCKTCETTYQNVTIGGVTSCKELTTCTDKHGYDHVNERCERQQVWWGSEPLIIGYDLEVPAPPGLSFPLREYYGDPI